ncbi:ABC transporter [Gloeomargarita lithophora Alchichica-D10]|uniref:ABC transporter n=1 Tax=Gloeomargarita lithophora Alchichica-D10 TaxID=1188229 RepID=A0A1J0AAZ3_9CYAN|nr:metal ABC transporter permease [Gloeomargarita lithophora]APB33073.1 ABC transporter [Gloeomargarita lithophora Alchichica-D10]
MEFLLEPLNFSFMQRALAMGLLTGILCPVVGSYLVVQRLALLGDVMAHCVIPGVALSVFLGIDRIWGAFIFGMMSTGVIHWLQRQTRIKVDGAMAFTFASFFALGILLISILKTQQDLEHLLFGDILSVTGADLWKTLIVISLLGLLLGRFYQPLLFFTFDPVGAQAVGLPVQWLNWGLLVAVTLTIIISMQAVGVILIVALMVGPALVGYVLAKELHWMMAIGSGVGVLSSVAGIYSSYYLNLPTGPLIILTATLILVLVVLGQQFLRRWLALRSYN